jgi:hypothetical protein
LEYPLKFPVAERTRGSATHASISNTTNRGDRCPSPKLEVVFFTPEVCIRICDLPMREYTRTLEEDLFAFRTFWSSFGPPSMGSPQTMAQCLQTINTDKSRQLRHNHRAVFTRLGQLFPTASARAVEAIISGNTFILKPIMPIDQAMLRRLNSSR